MTVVVRSQTASQKIYLQCLTNFEAYAEAGWVTNSTGVADAGYWYEGGSTGNGNIRGNAGVALAYATLCVALPNDPKYTNRLTRLRQALNWMYNTHVSGSYNTTSGSKWGWSSGTLATCTSQSGSDWQSAEWSATMGLACLLMQSNLPAATVTGVQTVIASEATHRAAIAPCTRALSAGDTKAEENAWDGNVLSLAAAWMTNNANASNWLYAAKSYLANTYTVAYSDGVTPNTTGDSLAAWVSTVTLFPSYALENHGFYHPTYEMVAGMSMGDSLLMARRADTNIAAQLQPFAEHNVMAVWTNNLGSLVTGAGDFAYPAGVDWAVRDFEHDSFLAWMASHFNDPLARWADDKLAQCVLKRQQAYGTGAFVGFSGGGFYREAVEARRTAVAWLHWNFADYPTGTMTAPASVVMNNTDVQVIHHRSSFGAFSMTYLAGRIMAEIEPAPVSIPTNAFVTSPRNPGMLGLGGLGNPTSGTLVSFTTNSDGFTAEVKLTSSAGTTEEYIRSTGESVAIIEVPHLGSTSSLTGSTSNFICGIENDVMTGGSRLVEWLTNSATFTTTNGTTRNMTNNWVCVSGNYGMAAGPSGYFRYVANSSYSRVSPSYSEAGEAEDALMFINTNQLAPRYAIWFPAKNALQTSNAAAAVTWVTNSTQAVLTFPGLNGTATTLSAYIGVSPTNNNGAWNVDANGNWSDVANWSSSIVADGSGYIGYFSALNITADRTVTLDSSRSIGSLRFGDSSGAQNWIVTNSGSSVLTLDSGTTNSPTLIVTNTTTFALPLAGTNGFTKTGPGTLILSGSNSLSGILNIDGGSSTVNEGAVRITSSKAVANITSPIYIRDNNSGSSTLQLDGSNGNIALPQTVLLQGRNVGVAAIQNLAGSNTIAGGFTLASGGGYYWFESDAGTLNLGGMIPTSASSVTSSRTLTFMGAGQFVVSGIITNVNGTSVSVLKSNTGALYLNGINTYTGLTTIAGGTLAGKGVIVGPVTVLSGAAVAPGDASIGSLTINNALTNNGSLSIRLNKTSKVLTNDTIKGVSTLVYGGTLSLVISGTQITAGDSFKIFNATNYFGAFTAFSPATPGTNLVWYTNNLAVNGTLSVVVGNITPQLSQVSVVNNVDSNLAVTGSGVILSGKGGAAGYGFTVLGTSDLTTPLANWTVIGTGNCDSAGNFIITNQVDSTINAQYYMISMP